MSRNRFIRKHLWLLPSLLIAWHVAWSVSLFAGEAQYAYDDLGRLATVVDEAGNTAIYNYDAVGNLLGIDRYTPGGSGIGIYALLPGKGAIGSQVKIQGYGFSATPTDNTVTFNGTAATVVSSMSEGAEARVREPRGPVGQAWAGRTGHGRKDAL